MKCNFIQNSEQYDVIFLIDSDFDEAAFAQPLAAWEQIRRNVPISQ